MNIRGGIMAAMTAAATVGCVNNAIIVESPVEKDTNIVTCAVTVGMEYSKFAGRCPGAGVDAKRMTSLLKAYTDDVVAFSSETAKKADVVAAMKRAAEKADLFIFFYSGHGGQQAFWNTQGEEDGKDEFLCLYDTYMRDDEIWNIISKAKGRVWFIADCCHSQTMFSNPSPITLKGAIKFSATHTQEGTCSILVWSGCPDDTYSYGDANGGQFTNAILRNFLHPVMTYDYLWGKIEDDATLKCYENVQRTIVGNDFGNMRAFQ